MKISAKILHSEEKSVRNFFINLRKIPENSTIYCSIIRSLCVKLNNYLIKCTFLRVNNLKEVEELRINNSKSKTIKNLTGDGLSTGGTPLGEELSETLCTVGLVIPGGEPLACQGLDTVGAGEALAMPRLVAVSNTTLGDHLK
jgi:hypothetical protein